MVALSRKVTNTSTHKSTAILHLTNPASAGRILGRTAGSYEHYNYDSILVPGRALIGGVPLVSQMVYNVLAPEVCCTAIVESIAI